jgi:hypothetical protein
MKIEIGTLLYHPCSVDIIEHKVIGIHQYETFTHYVCKATNNVGACGRLEIVLSQNKNRLTLVELVDEENIPHASGLQDFIEGNYYTTKQEALLEFYRLHNTSYYSNMIRAKDTYERAVKAYERNQNLIKTTIENIKELKKVAENNENVETD